MPARLIEIELRVADVERSRRFYRDLIGVAVGELETHCANGEPHAHATWSEWSGVGPSLLMLNVYPAHDAAPRHRTSASSSRTWTPSTNALGQLALFVPEGTARTACFDHHRRRATSTPMFPTNGNMWQVMHGDMGGLYEARDEDGGWLYRIFCVLDRNSHAKPTLVLVSGGKKPIRAVMDQWIYEEAKVYRDEYAESHRIKAAPWPPPARP